MAISASQVPPNTEDETAASIRRILRVIIQRRWLILLAIIVAGSGAYFYSKSLAPTYQSTTLLVVNQMPVNQTLSTDYTSLMTSDKLAGTYVRTILTSPILTEVIKRLNIKMTPDTLKNTITVEQIPDTQIINVSATSNDPNMAANIANMVYTVFSEYNVKNQTMRYTASIDSIQRQLSALDEQINQTQESIVGLKDKASPEADRLNMRLTQYEQTYNSLSSNLQNIQLTASQTTSNVIQAEPATASLTPIGPKVLQNTILAILAGFLLSVAGVLTFDYLDDHIKDPEDVKRQFSLPILGWIEQNEQSELKLITLTEPRSPITEAFRALRSNVQFTSIDHPVRTLIVTSCVPSEGKTTIVTNLAVTLAQSGKRVTIIDADLHRPRVHRLFELDAEPGLSSLFMQSKVYINGTSKQSEQNDLKVITAGEIPPNPSELLGSNKMGEIIDAALEQSDYVLIDTPPLHAVSDTISLAHIVDGVLLVVNPMETKMSLLKSAVEQLNRVGARIIGIAMNGTDKKVSGYSGYYGGHYYSQYNYSKSNGNEGSAAKKNRKVKILS